MALLPEDSQQRQRLLLGIMLVGLIGYGGYRYVYSPRAAEVAALETRLEALELQNQTARALTATEGTTDVEHQLTLYNRQLVQVEGLIPSSEELPDLLDAISAEARQTGVEISLIQPVGAAAEEFYTRRTYDLAVQGSYHQIGEFLTRIASLPRIITPINLNLAAQAAAPDAEPELEARFAIETYVLPSAPATADTAHVG
ncbi:MAG TPA: type 4a pilus biogenesis protein PilO [Longimicrobiaceae bacterium]|nr:type 4a pilus biogenesis protein PilO [Longimicrobiaceae bacterium]